MVMDVQPARILSEGSGAAAASGESAGNGPDRTLTFQKESFA